EEAAAAGDPADASHAAKPAAVRATRRGRNSSMNGSVPEVGSMLWESRGRAEKGHSIRAVCHEAKRRAAANQRLLAGFAGLLICAAASIAGADTPSPGDWRDIVIYQIVTDRFANGNPANDAVEGNYAPADGAKIHGGDFAGIQSRLDYLVNLGVG